jgi:hypothetical protein
MRSRVCSASAAWAWFTKPKQLEIDGPDDIQTDAQVH